MAPAPGPSDHSPSDTAEAFGANDWLLEMMQERWEADPSSVDARWQDFFAGHDSGNGEDSPSEPAPAKKPASEKKATAVEAAPQKRATAVEAAPQKQATSAEKRAPEPVAAENGSPRRATVERPNQVKDSRPSKTGSHGAVPADPPNPTVRPDASAAEPQRTTMRGAPMRTAKNMDASLAVPTATSVRSVPMKLVIDQRVVINNHLRRARGGKVSFTHVLGYALVKALAQVPAMNNAYQVVENKPTLVQPAQVNLGLAIDLPGKDGQRQLLVPSIKGCEDLNFAQFWAAYETLVQKARSGKLEVSDFAGTSITLTNPGTIGTNHSVPRLLQGQGAIIGVGSIAYPPEFEGADPERLNDLGVAKVLTLTSTYDHRIIQGAQSGEFLARMHQLLLGADGFYDEIFASLRIPYSPIRWATDHSSHHEHQVSKQAKIFELIQAYRSTGHLMADTDPLEYRQREHRDLDVQTHDLTLWDLDREFATGSFGGAKPLMKMREILGVLRDSYCRTIGIEYMHIYDPAQRDWIQQRVERPHVDLPREEHLRILDKLNEAEVFETFLQTKFVGQKRFSLEGGESTIVVLDELCELAANAELDEVCIGMPHRGRLNVLANIVGKSYAQIFREFDGNIDPRTVQGSGDVKYHLGAEGEYRTLSGLSIKTSVAANPSHLEAVNPVLEGITRGKQDHLDRGADFPVLPVLLHGDAAFAGQGVVMETLQMSQLRGYRTGGTVHVVVNNQVGFTTSPTESRSSVYATDVAKTVGAPIFHVNGDDPEACVRVARLAYEFREEFNKDVVIDVICYRRRGHNEGDDPSFTQPLMYKLIEQKRSVRKLYTEALIGRGTISVEDGEEVFKRFQRRLESVFTEVREDAHAEDPSYRRVPDYPRKPEGSKTTAITAETLKAVADAYTNVPEGFTVHPKVMPQLQRRAAAITAGPLDWATAEVVACGSLLLAGHDVRLTGQDSRRGTFVQRFAAVVDRETGENWVPLRNMTDEQGRFFVFDSLLSEFAAVGFEYGYSVARPEALVLWEAQFGDFVNGAQTITDEFISAGEAKWTQKSGVVLLLPHGYEGQGPDHSSARLERWLQLAAEGAITVAAPSTPASYFHLLRTQALSKHHRPLIVMTPKSMLRNKYAVSDPVDLTEGRWQPVLEDPTVTDPQAVEQVLLCSGKVRWDLVAQRARDEAEGKVAIIAVEQLYPLPAEAIAEQLSRYPQVETVRWVQEEPENQGAWSFIHYHLPDALAEHLDGRQVTLEPITRRASAAPSVGLAKVHENEQRTLVNQALRRG